MTNSQAGVHESRLVRGSPRDPRFSRSNINNFKCGSAQCLVIAGRKTAENISAIDVRNLGQPLPSNSLDLHHTQRQQDKTLD